MNEPDELSLKELILKLKDWGKYVLSKWIIILFVGTIGGIVGLILVWSKKPLYTAELTFVLEGGKSSGNLGGYVSLASQFGLGAGGGSSNGIFEGENLLAFMKSRSMIQKTLMTPVEIDGKRKTLAEFYIDINHLRKKWIDQKSRLQKIQFLVGADPSQFSLDQNSLINNFHQTIVDKNLSVGNKDKKTNIISVSVNSENELFSKYFAEVLVREVSNFYIETKTKKSLKSITMLKYQTDSVRRIFNSSISGAASSIDANPNPNISLQSLRVPSRLKEVDAQANQAMLIELMRNLAISQSSLREETPLIQIIDPPILPLPREDFSKSRALILGLISGAFLAITALLIRKFFEGIMS